MSDQEKLTACGECKWYVRRPIGFRPYLHGCLSPRVAGVFDPVTAQYNIPEHLEKCGRRCAKTNIDGHCPHFQPKDA